MILNSLFGISLKSIIFLKSKDTLGLPNFMFQKSISDPDILFTIKFSVIIVITEEAPFTLFVPVHFL